VIPLGVLNSLGAMVVTPGTDEEAADADDDAGTSALTPPKTLLKMR
jgi:hypothetical protein